MSPLRHWPPSHGGSPDRELNLPARMALVISQHARGPGDKWGRLGSRSAERPVNRVNASNQPLDDAQLLQQIARRDRQALAHFYDRHAGLLYSVLICMLDDRQTAGELLQNVFQEIWDKAEDYDRASGSPFFWALNLARQQAIARLRQEQRRYRFVEGSTRKLHTDDPIPAPASARELFGAEQATLIRIAAEELPLEQRQAIEMAFWGGMNQNEIAEALSQPAATIKARIRRGMLGLRDRLKRIL